MSMLPGAATPGTAPQSAGGAAPAGPPEAPAGGPPTAPVDIPPGVGEPHAGPAGGSPPLIGAQGGGTFASGSAPRFKPGSKVLYCEDGHSAPVRGTVAKVDRGASAHLGNLLYFLLTLWFGSCAAFS